MKKGKKGFLKGFALALLLVGATACSKKERVVSSDGGIDIHGNEIQGAEGPHSWGCDDSLNLISYIEKVHLAHARITSEKNALIREALRKILDKRKIPTPFFPQPLPTQASYVRFLPIESEKMETWLDHIEDEKKYCQTVEEITEDIEEKSFPVVEKKELLQLFHKGILRYFVASLDPHSRLSELLEARIGRNNNIFELDADENMFVAPPNIEDNPFFENLKKAHSTMEAYFLGNEEEIYYVQLFQFDKHTVGSFKEHYQQFVDSTVQRKAMIIDLRSNGGGDVSTVAELADLFLKEGPIFVMRRRHPEHEWEGELRYAEPGNELFEIVSIPVIILMSRYSASAAELFASAMQEHHAAVIIGERSFGKGTAQIVGPLSAFPLGIPSDVVLELTFSYTYSPSGRPIQSHGVEPDIEVYDHQYRDCLDRCGDPNPHSHCLRCSNCCEQAFFEAMHEETYKNAISPPEPFKTSFEEPAAGAWWLDLKQRLEKYYADLNGHFTFRSLIEFFEK